MTRPNRWNVSGWALIVLPLVAVVLVLTLGACAAGNATDPGDPPPDRCGEPGVCEP